MTQLQIKLFGPMEVIHAGNAPLLPDTAKVRSLLGYLITYSNARHHREKLAELLWPEHDSNRGRRLLSDALWRARRMLNAPGSASSLPASVLSIAGDTIAFQPDMSVWVDITSFQRLADSSNPTDALQGDLEQMQAAVDLYRGDFLEDCYDDWALYERERLRVRYLALLERLLGRYKESGLHDAALQIALRLVAADPLQEEAHQAVMQLLYLLGRENDAIRAYERCRDILRAELDVDPAPETQALFDEITALRAARARTVEEASSRPLEAGDAPFIGRREERAALLHALDQAVVGAGGMLLLTGDAGQGKSRLLRELAGGATWRGAQVSWGFGRADGQAQPLGPLREALSAMLTPLRVRQLAATLDPLWMAELVALLPPLADLLAEVPPRALLAPEHQLQRQYAAIRETLLALGKIAPQALLLEDIHWFDRATLGALEALLPHLRDARVLVVLSGRVDELPARADLWQVLLRMDRNGPLQRVELRGMGQEEAADLIRRLLGMMRLPEQMLERIYEVTGGNPFFIREMLRSLEEQQHLVRDRQGEWVVQNPDQNQSQELPLPASLQQTISARLGNLSLDDRRALATAAVLGQTFTPAQWAGMTTTSQLASSQQAETGAPHIPHPPEELLRRHFLVEERDGYHFEHHLLREVVYHALSESERQDLHLRAAEALEREHYARIEALAHHLCNAGAWAKAIPYLVQVGDRARELCAYSDALRAYDQALEASSRVSGVAGADIWSIQLKRGAISTLLGEYEPAIAAYRQVLLMIDQVPPLYETAAQRSAQIQTLNGLCYVYGQRNEYREAQLAIRRALELAQGSVEAADRADVAFQAGLLYYRQDEYEQSETYLLQALSLYESIDAPEVKARLMRCLDALVPCWSRREGVTNRVLESQVRALALCRELGDQQGERDCLLTLSNLYLLRGDIVLALSSSDQVLPFLRRTNARDTIAQCQYLRGAALYLNGRLEESLEALNEALALCQELGRGAAAQFVQLYIGRALHALGRIEEAETELERACNTSDRLVKARALSAFAEFWLDRGQLERAFALATQALPLVRDVGARPQLGRVLRVLGMVRAADPGVLAPPTDEAPAAEPCFLTSMALLEAARHDGELGETHRAYGQWLLTQGRLQEAHTALVRAQALFTACSMQRSGERVQALLRRYAEQAALEDGPQAARRLRLRNLCVTANAQGNIPTIDDLAQTLGVTVRTVSRDLAALRAAGEVVQTRGSR